MNGFPKTAADGAVASRDCERKQPDPFPPGEDPLNVQGERYHIEGCYAEYLKQKECDGFSAMLNLWECVQFHPGLKAEAGALKAVNDGHNALMELIHRPRKAAEAHQKLSGLETWLAKRVDEWCGSTTMERFLYELRDIPVLLRDNPATRELADSTEAMLEGHKTMMEIRPWLDTL
jgi:hypothetical protein